MVKLTAAKIDGFLKRPDPAIRGVLLYGPDSGLVRERAQILGKQIVDDLADPFRVADLANETLVADPARLADEAAAIPLTGGRRLVRVRGAADAAAVACAAWLKDPGPGDGLVVVVEAGELGASSRLRKAFEDADTGAAIACYVEEEKDVRKVIAAQLEADGLAIDADALDLLASRLVGDRLLARNEAIKLSIYMGVGLPDTRIGRLRVTVEDVREAVGDSADLALDDAVLAAADGDFAATDRAVQRLLDEGVSPVQLLRAAQSHFQRLQLLLARVQAGEGLHPAGTQLWRPVFFRVQARVTRQAQRWTVPMLGQALDRLLEAEADCKRTDWPDMLVCARTFLEIAQTARQGAARAGRR